MTQSSLHHPGFLSPKEMAFSISSYGARSSLACVQCRRQHLKCDAHLPLCSRCQSNGEECHYVKSRRGGRRIRKSMDPGNIWSAVPDTSNILREPERLSSIDLCTNECHPVTANVMTARESHKPADQVERSSFQPVAPLSSLPVSLRSDSHSSNGVSQSVRQYYDYFHEAHPYILPEPCLLERIARDDGQELQSLVLVLRFIGSCYVSKETVHLSKIEASSALLEKDPPKTGFTVQALLLFSLGLTFYGERDQGYAVLKIAVNLALNLGMNWSSFAIVNGEGSSVLEESWRRTWWGLFITDASLAANHNEVTFQLFTTDTDVPLPCEDAAYSIGQIPAPQSLVGFYNREFAEEEVVYSSFAYQVEIFRIIGDVMAALDESNAASRGGVAPIFEDQSATNQKVATADTKLANWDVQLPQLKRQPIRRDGQVDSLMLTAHLMRNWLVLALHRPRSMLQTRPEEIGKVCLTIRNLPRSQCSGIEVHTLKCMRAADNIASLVTIPSIYAKQSPFATCAIVAAVVAHVAACSDALAPGQITPVKDRIRLCLGMARALGEIWPFADSRFQEAKVAARGFFGPSKPAPSSPESGMNHTPQGSNSQTLSNANGTYEQPSWTNDSFFPQSSNMSLADIGYTLSNPTAWDGEDVLNRNWLFDGTML